MMFKSSHSKRPFLMRCMGAFLPLLLPVFAQAQVSGTVFRDFNANGVKDNTATLNEPFVQGVTVTAYNSAGTATVTTTNASGAYSFTGLTLPLRIEFELPSVGACVQSGIDFPSFSGGGNGSSVQFVSVASTNTNFAINNPTDYNTGAATATIFVPRYVNGNPLPPGSPAGYPNAFVGFPYTNTNRTQPAKTLNGQTIGATWGVAYSRQANKIFTSAFLKRHVGLGTMGSGGIYLLTPTANTFTTSAFFDMDNNAFNTANNPITRTRAAAGAPAYGASSSYQLNGNFDQATYLGATDPLTNSPYGLGVIGSNTDRGLPTDTMQTSYDPAAFDQIGKVGLGGLEISDDGKYLFVMNLYSRKVFRLTLNDAYNPTSVTAIMSYDLPNPNCTNGVLRPFALKYYRDKLYAGAICSAENGGQNVIGGATDMYAYVYELNNPTGAANFNATAVVSYPLNYRKGPVRDNQSGASLGDFWLPWSGQAGDAMQGNTRPTPILSDIEFTDNGDLIMDYTDRSGHQWGSENYKFLGDRPWTTGYMVGGDLLIAGRNCGSNTFTLETNGSFTSANGQTYTGGVANNQGIGGGEFFTGESYRIHQETSLGSLSVLPGQAELFITSMDPYDWNSGGMKHLSTTTGLELPTQWAGYELYHDFPQFGKANGLGDVELLTLSAPLEIGNRVWNDTDSDGIQDAGEAGINGVTVNLYLAGTQVATATTSGDGNYYFNNANVTMNGATGIVPNTAYEIRIPNISGGSKQAALGTNVLTAANAGSNDNIDSDATISGVNAIIAYTTGNAGENNHSLDMGFMTPTSICAGEEYALSVPSGTSGEWYKDGVATGNTTTTYTVTTAGTYSFIGTVVGGCSISSCTNEVFVAGPCATIGNYVWNDANSDGLQTSEAGINGVTVELWKETAPSSGTYAFVRNTVTANNGVNDGAYLFNVSEAANYKVKFPTTSGALILTTQTATAATDGNSDADATGFSPVFAMNPAGTGVAKDNMTLDAGYKSAVVPTIATTVNISGCFDSNGNTAGGTSQSTVQVIVDWANALSEDITVSVPNGGAAQTFDPNTGAKPRILNFSVPTASATTGNVTANYVTTTTVAATPKAISIAASNCLLTPCTDNGGQVFRDFNNNGTIDTYETEGISSVTVTAYWSSGASTGTATTTTDYKGQYNIATGSGANQIPSGAKVRIEFTGLPTGLTPTASGTNNGTAVQFFTAPVCNVNMGVNYPTDYCQANPNVLTPVYTNGCNTADKVISGGPYNSTTPPFSGGQWDSSPVTTPLVEYGTAADLGAVWGVAYQRKTKSLFTAAFIKSHVGLGPLGIGGIYKINTATSAVSNFLDVSTLVNVGTIGSNATRGLTNIKTDPNHDSLGFALTAKVGIGGLDITDDDSKLFFTNLYDKKLYSIVIDADNNAATAPVAADVTSFTIPDPGCNNGVARPWGVKVKNGKVYVGVVCTAETSGSTNDLSANVYVMDIATGVFNTNPVLSFPLTYAKNDVEYGAGTHWLPWTDDFNDIPQYSGDASIRPQPILSDIDFDTDGSMILAFNDRTGHQLGYNNYQPNSSDGALYRAEIGGDILRASYTNSGGYILENNGVVGGLTGSAQNTAGGPGDGEFYDDAAVNIHHDAVQGGIALRTGSGQVLGSFMDPLRYVSGGINTWSNTDGARTNDYELYWGWDASTFGKANGMGDLEMMCNEQPLEIGNYVWIDADSDGIQDPSEAGITGVQVRLYNTAGTLVGVTTTDAKGEYYFNTSNVDNTGMSAAGVPVTSLTGLAYDTQYYVVLGANGTFTSGNLNVAGTNYQLTAANTGEGANADGNDSDASIAAGINASVNGFPYISVLTGAAGTTNHTYDFGLKSVGSVGNYVWNDTNSNGTNDEAASAGINGVTVELWNAGADGVLGGTGVNEDVLVGTTTTANDGSGNAGYYNFVVTASGNYYVKFPTTNGATILTTATTTAATDGNSDADASTGNSPVFAIDVNGTGVAKDNMTLDAGYKVAFVPPSFACSDVAKLGTPMFVNGDPLAGTATGASNGFMVFNYNDSGNPTGAAGASLPAKQMGAVWGTAYKSQNQKMYTSAFYKRHAGFGPLGLGGIYEVTPQGVPSATSLIDLTTLGVNVGTTTRTATAAPVDGANELATAPMEASWDSGAFAAVGKRSLGGLDISDDGNTMYTMNLFEKKLTILDISGASPSLTAQVTVADPGCADGDYRPFAVKYFGGKVYVGTVCSAETSQNKSDLKAYVQSYDGSTWTTVSPAMSLNFARGFVGSPYVAGNASTPADWNPWHDTYSTLCSDPQFAIYPQPILSDLEFDVDGSIILGFMDRNAHQIGGVNYTPNYPSTTMVSAQSAGDIMRLCANGASYTLENGAACNGGAATHSPLNGQGPGGGEYYWGDMTPWNYWVPNSGLHEEAAHGALAFKPGSGEIVTTAMNPTGAFISGGVIALSNTTGERTDQYQLYVGADQFGKAAGLGDLEIFCTPAVEYGAIGNYVWMDNDGDGIFDAGVEDGLNGVIVKLYKSTDGIVGNGDDVYVTETVTARDATGTKGFYYFPNLVSGNYFVQFQTALPTNVLAYPHVLTKQTSATNTDNDSDPNATTGNSAMVAINTTLTGIDRYNYTIDAGYAPTAKVGNYVWNDLDGDGTYNDGTAAGINGVTVELWSAGADNAIGGGDDVLSATQVTVNDGGGFPGFYLFDKVTYGNYYIHFPTTNGTTVLTAQTTTAYTDWNSDADATTGNTPVFLMDPLHWSGEFTNNMTLDAGYKALPTGSIGHFVWIDANYNGTQELAEKGIAGITVTLYDATGTTVIAATQTDAYGYYLFPNLPLATYTVGFTPPIGYMTSPNNVSWGTSQTDSDIDLLTSRTAPITLTISAKDRTDIDAGFYYSARKLGSLGDFVWLDTNNDGLQNTGEKGVAGVLAELYDGTTFLGATVTDGNGYYLFQNLSTVPTLHVKFTPPAGLLFTTQTVGSDNTIDSDVDPVTGTTGVVDFSTYYNNPRNYDAGLVEQAATKGSIGDRVWKDTDNDGIQDTDEVGASDIIVELLNGSGVVIASTTTNSMGDYIFNNLDAATYSVRFTFPTTGYTGYTFVTPNAGSDDTKDSDANPSGATATTGAIVLTAGEKNLTVDAGIYNSTLSTASVGDYVWYDSDRDGVQDASEKGVSGVTVVLLDAHTGNEVAQTTTDEKGFYLFPNVAVNSYAIRFENLPNGYVFTQQGQGGNTNTDSDAGVLDGMVYGINVAANQHVRDIDAGIIINGTKNGEASLGNYVWYDDNNNGLQEPNEAGAANVAVKLYYTWDLVTPIRSVVTDAQGYYLFTGLLPSQYLVKFTAPAGYSFSPQTQGSNTAIDSDVDATGNANYVSLYTGDVNLTVDAGLYNASAPTGKIGDYVWYDANTDGVQDAGEQGVPGVGVKLYDKTTGNLVAVTTTDKDGKYLFTQLPFATYYIVFDNVPTGMTFTTQGGGTTATDSDADATGKTGDIVLNAGSPTNYTIDAGLNSTRAALGDYVWYDTNADGEQDTGELPVRGVTVNLYDAAGTTLIASAITDKDGRYLFSNLTPATYIVEFTGLPEGTYFTKANASGIANDKNSDAVLVSAPQGIDMVGRTSTIVLAAGDFNTTIDAGIGFKRAGLGDYVWYDTDKDGVQDPTEVGVAGVKVVLYDGASNLVAASFTNGEGYYFFDRLVPGDYSVLFAPTSLPTNYAFTQQDAATSGGNDTNDSDANTTTGQVAATTLIDDEFDTTFDAGIYLQAASLGNYVWLDTDKDGIQDAAEVGVAGVTVTLYDNTGKAISTTKTDAYGKYLFTELNPGNYTVGFSLPTNYVFTTEGSRTDSGTATDNDADTETGRSGVVALSAGETDLKVDAGIYFAEPTTQSVGDYVWFDTNGDGIQDATEKGVSGVTITLYNSSNTPIATTITDGNGGYLFSNLPTGDYSILFGTVPGMLFTSQTSSTDDGSDADVTGKTATFTLNTGDNRRDIDAGFVATAAIKGALGDKVWYDVNNNGVQDLNEAGVEGVTVNLYDALNAVLATTKTDALGNYLFDNLAGGRYRVVFDITAITGYSFVAANATAGSATDENDSDADGVTGKTAWYTLAPGEKNLTVDAGIFKASAPLGGIGNFVWLDADKDGVQDATETGVGGVTATLYAADGTTVLATTVTDKTGYYAFNNLPAASYIVGFSNLPTGFVLTTQTSNTADGSDANTSTGKTNAVAVNGSFIDDVDAGLYPSGTPSGKGSLGDYVWYDLNNNGVQDASEQGVNDVVVTLYAANGTTVLATQKTDPTGHYLFTGLDKGDYIVGFSSLPSGYSFSPKDATNGGGNDVNDSDVNSGTAKTDLVSLAQGEDKLTVDAGIYKSTAATGAIGNYVWYDLDGNGLQDDGATGVQGVSVVLIDKTTGTIVATTTTDKDGGYLFTQVPFGTYTVQFGNLPEGFTFTTPESTPSANGSDANPTTGKTGDIVLNAGSPTNMNIDAGIQSTIKAGLGNYVWLDTNGDGIQNDGANAGLAGVLVTLYDGTGVTKLAATVTDATGYYQFTNLDAGTYVVGFSNLPLGATFTKQDTNTGGGTDENDSDATSTGVTAAVSLAAGTWNPTIDAGVTLQKAGLGDYVWYDANLDGLQTTGEKPVAGVLITLYDNVTNSPLAKTVTDGNGYYSFTGLNPGSYYLVFDPTSLPTGAVFTTQTSNTANGSDADVSTGQTAVVSLVAGEFNPNIDAGITKSKAALGDFVWVDVDINGIQDGNEMPVTTGVLVNLYLASDPLTVIDSRTTDAKGFYWFENLDPNDYVVEFTTLSGFTRTIPTGQIGGSQTGETLLYNSDADALTGKTSTITLAAGARNPNIDAGYFATTLPVKLLYFRGNAIGCEVHLNWATASEENSRSFEVWSSTDGNTWTRLATIAAAGNSNTMRSYNFTDKKPNRTNFYRLVQIDIDGTATNYNLAQRVTTNGCFEETANGISGLYPNPNATNQVTVKFYTDRNDTEIAFELYDIAGKFIGAQRKSIVKGANVVDLDISNLAEGVYLIKAVGDGWYSLPERLIKIQD